MTLVRSKSLSSPGKEPKASSLSSKSELGFPKSSESGEVNGMGVGEVDLKVGDIEEPMYKEEHSSFWALRN